MSADGGPATIEVRELTRDELAQVDAVLPLHRLDHEQTYLVAWLGDEPVGHLHVAWARTRLGIPEIQDVFVLADRRRRGVAAELNDAAERLARTRGHTRISISHGIDNEPAARLYDRLGYRDAGLPPQHVSGVIVIRGENVEIDDSLIYLSKDIGVDSGSARSSKSRTRPEGGS